MHATVTRLRDSGFEVWCSPDCGIVLCHGDCLRVLPLLDTSEVACLLTDPPYGIGESAKNHQSRNWHPGRPGNNRNTKRTAIVSKDYGVSEWDTKTHPEGVAAAIAVTKHAIVWGGNYYALPPSPCWLVWDKDNGANDFADCELAWTNLNRAVRKFRWRWQGMLQERMGDAKEEKFHPTQKPLPLIEWCLTFLPPGTILDPYMGSGTIPVACLRTGRRCLAIEIEPQTPDSPDYFGIAVRRVQAEIGRHPLFEPPPKRQRELIP